ncbi:MAG TPA: hypothetical protein VEJ18_04950, partial [Planctomycetota bacterium]|nr:hypothetical protein [Planctomycetota bacterium]
MYELLAGRPPFVGSMYEVLRRTVNERPVPPSHVVKLKAGSGDAPPDLPPLPEGLEALCLRCLEKNRDARPPSALDVAKEIGAIAEGKAVSVTPSGRILRDPTSSMSAPVLPTPPPMPVVRLAPDPARTWIRAAVAAVVLLCLGGAAWLAVSGAAAARRDQARRHLAEFRPELVHEGTVADSQLLQAAVVLRAFKLRLVGALNARPPSVQGALEGDRARLNMRVLRAKDELVVFDAGAGPDGASWAELRPEGIAVLARACGLGDAPADRLGLALAHLYGGRPQAARPLLEALRGTSLDEEAGRWLARLPSRG